jgi:hypothetical protein
MKRHLLLLAALLLVPLARAQVVLQDFSAFTSPNTFFLGSWELTGDTGGSTSPRASFSQGAGFYNITGGTNSDTAGVFFFFSAPLNLTGLSLLEVSARTLAGNTAPTFTISLFDSLGESAFATFATSAFAGAGFTTVQTALTFSPGFDKTDLFSFLITGNTLGGTAPLNVAFNNLAVVAPSVVTAVPGPSAYGLAAASVLLAVVGFRRRPVPLCGTLRTRPQAG